mmetsp:Transcript_33142/g.71530  ORF Transcript_33142/g.71530 Transcript_33142/m.71530 type:complete len:210 (+) Transcript_33142:898-1527(+)
MAASPVLSWGAAGASYLRWSFAFGHEDGKRRRLRRTHSCRRLRWAWPQSHHTARSLCHRRLLAGEPRSRRWQVWRRWQLLRLRLWLLLLTPKGDRLAQKPGRTAPAWGLDWLSSGSGGVLMRHASQALRLVSQMRRLRCQRSPESTPHPVQKAASRQKSSSRCCTRMESGCLRGSTPVEATALVHPPRWQGLGGPRPWRVGRPWTQNAV